MQDTLTADTQTGPLPAADEVARDEHAAHGQRVRDMLADLDTAYRTRR